MIRNILFDWSGTLVDDLPAVWKATNAVLAQAQGEEMSLDMFRGEFCLPFSRFYERHAPAVDLPRLESWYMDHFRGVQDSVRELPHAREFLEFCRARGVRCFLLSSIHADHFLVQSEAIGFAGCFEKAYVAVRDKRHQIHDLIAAHGLDPAETLFIGDMQHDIETARHGGVRSCAVLTGYNTLSQLRAAAPDLIVEHLGELRALLERSGMDLPAPGAGTPAAPIPTVGGLIFDDRGRVLMLRTHKWSDLWGIPGGKIKWGESSIDALRRELLEETGLEIDDLRFVLVQDCIHSKEFYRDAHFILLNYTCRCAGTPRVVLNSEAREFRWVSLAEACELPLNHPTRVLVNAVMKARSAAMKGTETDV
ncbi:MAG: NUDIX domain-containing protein [Verrucomicrobiota bacterium]